MLCILLLLHSMFGSRKTFVRCSFHMVAEPRSEGALDAMPSSDGVVLVSEEEQELTEIDILKKQLEESKAEQEKMNATIQDLIKMMELFEEQEKHKGQAMHEADQGGAEGSMSKLEGFNKKDMIKPPFYDMDPGNFLNWTELFTTYMMSIDEQWEGILKKLEKVDTALSRDAIDDLQDNLKMTHAVKKSANHASGKAQRRVIANAVDICSKGKNATKMDIVITTAEVLRPARATKIEDIEDKK